MRSLCAFCCGINEIFNKTKNETYNAQPFPEFMQNIMAADGLVGYVKSKQTQQ